MAGNRHVFKPVKFIAEKSNGIGKTKPGAKVGKWTISHYVGDDIHQKDRWNCICECGNKIDAVSGSHIRTGKSLSCGCARGRPVHGATSNYQETTEYGSWRAMTERCSNFNNNSYHRYGGRGIKVCEEWKNFSEFLKDMGKKPTPKHTIERIDVNGNYEKNNCKWIVNTQQARNTTRTAYAVIDGKNQLVIDLCKEKGLSISAIRSKVCREKISYQEAVDFYLNRKIKCPTTSPS